MVDILCLYSTLDVLTVMICDVAYINVYQSYNLLFLTGCI